MGMFDTIIGELECPECREVLEEGDTDQAGALFDGNLSHWGHHRTILFR